MKGVQRPGGAGLQVARRAPVLKTDPNFHGMLRTSCAAVDRVSGAEHAGRHRVQAQYILCDMAAAGDGRLSIDAALKEAHKRVEDIYRIRSRAERRRVSVPAAQVGTKAG